MNLELSMNDLLSHSDLLKLHNWLEQTAIGHDHQGLHQIQNSFKPDKDRCGQNVVLLQSTVQCEVLNVTTDIEKHLCQNKKATIRLAAVSRDQYRIV